MNLPVVGRAALARLSLVGLLAALTAAAATPRGAPKFTAHALDLGSTRASATVPVTVWLRMHNGDGLANLVQSQHDRTSANYAQWADDAALEAAFAPTAAEVATVKSYLTSRGLTVTAVGKHNLSLTARGTPSQVQSAFNTSLHDFQSGKRTFYANASRASLPSSVQALVSHVSLTNLAARPLNVRPVAPDGSRYAPHKIASKGVKPNGLIYSARCLRKPSTVQLSSADATAQYTGNTYGADINNTDPGTVAPCGYQPSEIQAAYNLNRLYAKGLNGAGQTIAIVDAFGSTTLAQDLAIFDDAMGLPAANLTILGTPTGSNYDADPNVANWAGETTLDVEWAHAIAPGAHIVLVVAADDSLDNLFGGDVTAVQTPGVSVVSNSWDSVEIATDPELRSSVDGFFQFAAAKGIALNFSSGDSGDEAINYPGYTSVDWPASSPWVTAVGGVSVSLDKSSRIEFQSAWGNNFTQVSDALTPGNPPLDPVSNLGFQFGGGGGVSDAYRQPWFQRGLPGNRRLVPDISWVADPFTGVELVYTGDDQGDVFVATIGGTSLAAPMFSALWAIAGQRAGHRLGQAAPYVYGCDGNAVTDVTAVSSPHNVSGVIRDAGGISPEVASDLASPLQNLPEFFSALYQSPGSGSYFVITFGTDSTLKPGPGYDVATGVGVPNPPEFVRSVTGR